MHRPTQRGDSLRERVLAGRVRRDTRDRRAAAARKGSRRMVALFAGLAMVAGVITATQLTSSAGEDREQGLGENECEVAPPEEEADEGDDAGEGEDAAEDDAEAGDEAEEGDTNSDDSGWGEGGEFSTEDQASGAPSAATDSTGELVAVWHNDHWMMVTPEAARDWNDDEGDQGWGNRDGDEEPADGDAPADNGDTPADDCEDNADGDGAGDGNDGDGNDGDGNGDGNDGAGDGNDGDGDGNDGDGDGNGDGNDGDGQDPERERAVVPPGGADGANNGLDILGRDCSDSDLPLHEGFQEEEAVCVETGMGEQAALENQPTLLITESPTEVGAGQPFSVTVSTQNLIRDRFLGAGDGGYYLEASRLDPNGIPRGHFHIGCQIIDPTQAPDPVALTEPSFFLAVEDNGGGQGLDFVSIDIPGLEEPGTHRCTAWSGDPTHRTHMMSFARQQPAVDTFRVEVG